MSTSARFALPYILPGQAQKEVFHNEALSTIDAALHAAVEGNPLAIPPATPGEGAAWIVAAGATAAWSGKDDALAIWTGGGWRFVSPAPGMTVWNKLAGVWIYWDGGGWSDGSLPTTKITIEGQQVVGARVEEVPSPSGGSIIDVEARASIAALIAALKSHGLTN